MGGTIARLFKKKEVRVLMQGLDAAGKTTILYRLKLGEVVTTIPTIGKCMAEALMINIIAIGELRYWKLCLRASIVETAMSRPRQKISSE